MTRRPRGRPGDGRGERRSVGRAQSNVVGVALLLGVTVLTMGSLTASIGAVVDGNAATADATRVAADLDDALDPVATTGANEGRVSFTSGRLRTADRELRILNDSGTVETVRVDALVFETRGRRVTYLGGAVVRGTGNRSRMVGRPPLTASRTGGGVLVVGAPALNATPVSVGGNHRSSLLVRTNVTHERTALGEDAYGVAVETETPGAWVDYFEAQNATVETATADGDDDGVESVVARYPGRRTGYLVVHDMRLEVSRG